MIRGVSGKLKQDQEGQASSSNLKGHCQEMDFFGGANNLRSFNVVRKLFTSRSSCLLLWNFLYFALKMLTFTLLKIPFSVIGQCSPVSTTDKCRENEQELTCHRWLPVWFYSIRLLAECIFGVKIAALGLQKRVTERISKLASNFKEAS